MENNEQAFEDRKKSVLQAAKEQGIVHIFQGSDKEISLETVELATMLMKKYGPGIQKELAKRRQKPE